MGHTTLAGPPAAFTNNDSEGTCPSCQRSSRGHQNKGLEALPITWARHQLPPTPQQPRRPPSTTPVCPGGSRARAYVSFVVPPKTSLQWVSLLILCSFQWHFHLFLAFGNTILPLKPEKHFAVVLMKKIYIYRHTIVFAQRSLSFLEKEAKASRSPGCS